MNPRQAARGRESAPGAPAWPVLASVRILPQFRARGPARLGPRPIPRVLHVACRWIAGGFALLAGAALPP
ncbi:hypothetical protein DWV00_08480 [Trinickia dinghuensis]|uniref:Uncharacterized protein n=1 Tax=Trinickia dinghuensis TaxID=2291023 RepID=A0A3D8K145_9BURK|nr:hypothetical protein DWV00_08480 [Trinickia dinghuensis]